MKLDDIFSSVSCSLAKFRYPFILEEYSFVKYLIAKYERKTINILVTYSFPSIVTVISGIKIQKSTSSNIHKIVKIRAWCLLLRTTVIKRKIIYAAQMVTAPVLVLVTIKKIALKVHIAKKSVSWIKCFLVIAGINNKNTPVEKRSPSSISSYSIGLFIPKYPIIKVATAPTINKIAVT